MLRLSSLILLSLAGAARMAAQGTPPITPIGTLNGVVAHEFATVPGSGRIYISNSNVAEGTGELWLYDRATKRSTLVIRGAVDEPAISPKGDRVAFTRTGEDRKDDFIWSMPLNPKTGLSAGPARRVSMTPSAYAASFSPDGKLIAFAFDQGTPDEQAHIAIVPATGGRERVIAESYKWMLPLRWSADGKWIYFGNGGTPRSVKRAAVAGGVVETLMTDSTTLNFAFLGMSGDARMFVNGSGRQNQTVVVSDVAWKQLGTFTLPRPLTRTNVWTGPASLLVVSGDSSSIITRVSLSDGSTKRLNDGAGSAVAPAISPDGRRIAWLQPDTGKTTLVLINADGSGGRSIQLRHEYVLINDLGRRFDWSPDGRSIAYVGGAASSTLSVVDVETGREREIMTGVRTANAAWMADSRRLFFTTQADSSAAGRRRHLHLFSLDGGDRVVRTVTYACPACAWPIGDSAVVFGRAGATSVMSLKDGAEPRLILPDAKSPSGRSAPAVSPDGRWLAFRIADSLDVMKVDGSNRRRIHIPGRPMTGDGNHNGEPVFTADSRDLLAISRVGSKTVIQRVTLATGVVKQVLTLDRAPPTMRDFSFTADGSALVYAMEGVPTTHLGEINLLGIIPRPPGRTP